MNSPSTANPTSTIKPAAFLLIRGDFSGSGRKSIPLGEIVSRTGPGMDFSFPFSSGGLFSVVMADFHLLRLFAGTQYELRMLEQAIDDVGLLLHSIVHDFTFAVRSQNHKDRSLAARDVRRHLDVGLRAVIEHAQRATVFVAA